MHRAENKVERRLTLPLRRACDVIEMLVVKRCHALDLVAWLVLRSQTDQQYFGLYPGQLTDLPCRGKLREAWGPDLHLCDTGSRDRGEIIGVT